MNVLKLPIVCAVVACFGATGIQAGETPEKHGKIRRIDLSGQTNSQSFVRHGSKTEYWGHPTTALLADGKTVYCVYPHGHGGSGGFLSVSEDGGRHWTDASDRLPAIARRYYNCPCLHKLLTPEGRERLIYWQAGIAPDEKSARNACFVKSVSRDDSTALPACASDDGGLTWRALAPLGPVYRNILPFQGIVALKGRPGRYLGVYHRGDVGCYDGGHLEVLAATTEDGGLTWSRPRVIAEDPRWQLCEPWVFRAPDGNELCCLIRENGGTPAKVIFSRDEGATWSKPIDAPWFLNGHRHQGIYLQDGRLAIVFRCVEKKYVYNGQFIAWIGTYDELKSGREGTSCHIKLIHNFSHGGDCGYAGIHQLPDGTILATTYNACAPEEKCSVVSIRFHAPAAAASRAAEVRRVILPERLDRGDTSVVPLSPIDSAAWIAPSDCAVPPGGLFLRFRRAFESDGSPLRFHVSADERFILLLDGKVVARGPDRGEPNLWFFQTYETVPEKGRHVFDAIVWKLNPGQAPNAQLSWRLGFVFAAEGRYADMLTTGRAAWKVARLSGTAMTRGRYPTGAVGAQCEVVGTGLLDEEPTNWQNPSVVRSPIVPNESHSSRQPGWLLFPSQLPAQIARAVRPGRCVAVDEQAFVTNGFYSKVADEWGSNAVYRAASAADPRRARFNELLAEGRPLTVPPHTRVRFLWNLDDYYCAYPELRTSGGRGATVAWGWAEALYVGDCFDWHTVVTNKVRKGFGNRNDFAGKYFYGITDTFRPDGRADGFFTAPWWRCGLFCQLEVKTEDEPLTLKRVGLSETRYPFESEAYFHCDDASLDDVQRICLRGLQMCMHEMHFDCPHYEQQMYGGDTRLQMMISQVLSPDDAMNRQAFRLLEVSQRDNGLVSMNYPTVWLQESTSFSQYWAMMLGDYALWRDNAEWLRARMPAVRRLLFGLERYVGSDGLQAHAPGWHFVDWVPTWSCGMTPGHEAGCSSIENLLYLLTLKKAVATEEALGETELAARGRRLAEALAARILARFWCEARGLVADTPAMNSFSEHAQALAVLTGILSPERQRRVIAGLERDADLARCTASFSSYLFEAYFACGRPDLFLKKLDVWRAYVRMGLRTPLEGPGDARSDCHAWSSNPLYHLHAGIAGVRPAEAGFRSVRIAPQPGPLKWYRSKTATPKGAVVQDLRFEDGKASGTITLPQGLSGNLIWHGRTTPLAPGANAIRVP